MDLQSEIKEYFEPLIKKTNPEDYVFYNDMIDYRSNKLTLIVGDVLKNSSYLNSISGETGEVAKSSNLFRKCLASA